MRPASSSSVDVSLCVSLSSRRNTREALVRMGSTSFGRERKAQFLPNDVLARAVCCEDPSSQILYLALPSPSPLRQPTLAALFQHLHTMAGRKFFGEPDLACQTLGTGWLTREN